MAVGWKMGWIRIDGDGEQQGWKLFLLVTFCGNLLGLALTIQSGNGTIFSDDYRMEREDGSSYEEELLVSVEGEDQTSLNVEIPEKEDPNKEEEENEEEEETLSPEALRQQELLTLIEEYNQKKADPDYYYLPGEWKGKHLQWQKPDDTTGAMMSALALVAGVLLMVQKKREKLINEQKRQEQLLMDYPGLIMKFTLLVQAGMTVRKAFQKMALDYGRTEDKQKRYAYEEIKIVCYEMDSGLSEVEAYRRFGERCGQVKYKTFATLLIQNLQKGGKSLSDMLERESMDAWDERKRKARVLGETAATKLLFPMVLMMIVVMAIIIIPAGMTFYT
jgi:tight adherence protein C